MTNLQKSDIGAQSAWKGFTSQTLYIASRLISDKNDYEYYPEDVEDLVVKKDGTVIEAVQVKNISADLTLSSLASTATSKHGDGFFKRMCNLHTLFPSFHHIKVVYFNNLGTELLEVEAKNAKTKATLAKRLENKHGLSEAEAIWLIDSLYFEKVSLNDLDSNIQSQIINYVPVMSAPGLAKELLIHHISMLSKSKGYITLKKWQTKIHEIGTNIAAIDGFYKEYNKSLVCLSEFHLSGSPEQIRQEYSQGISAHPTHIRNGLDFKRGYWIDKIHKAVTDKGVALLKGVSGQGKSSLCYRYLIDTYPEGCVFCVRSISSDRQAQSLVTALDGLGKHNENLIIYIDVQPGETHWAFLLQELQARGLSIPVLISIRDEDYNLTSINGKSIEYEIIELTLSKEEAGQIYDAFTATQPHAEHRSFEEAWQSFGEQGPFIEFAYLLSNNQTLKRRLNEQIDALIQGQISDDWLELLQLVCYAGRLGCSVDIEAAKKQLSCSTMHAAIRRLQDEYLIRVVENKKLESLHPVRAQIIFEALATQTCATARDIVFKALACVSSHNVRVILLDYFSVHPYNIDDVKQLSQIAFSDWTGYANVIRSMLWLDTKRYVDANMPFINSLVDKRGKGWLCFLPLDLTGIDRPDELIADGMKSLSIFNRNDLQGAIDEVKSSLTSLSVDYQATDYFISHCSIPLALPDTDTDRSSLGYALFWLAKRGQNISFPIQSDRIVTSVCDGELQSCSDAIRGLYEHPVLSEIYQTALDIIIDRLIIEMNIITFTVSNDEVVCKFVPPLSTDPTSPENTKNPNQYWRIKMLDILKQLYPDKEYIDIELIGVDLYQDFGIAAMDHKLHIHKSNRHNSWITELNSWIKIRIDYFYRPKTWQQYVSEIDALRKNSNELVVETIKLIDDVYKKGRYTADRGNGVDKLIDAFKKHTFAENRLPYFAVDPYCLYSESNNKQPVVDYFPMRQLLSVSKYETFRKCLNDTYSSLVNFFNQFVEVLLTRVRNQDICNVKNPKLAMYNLFTAAKALVTFQNEYSSLFSTYSSLDENFEKHELENLLTLVNIWRHVLDNPPKGYAIAYDAKQRYRRGINYFDDTLLQAVSAVNGTLFKGNKYAYIIAGYELDDRNPLENEYTRIVMTIRDIFKNSVPYSSDRWYSESQSLELAYIPVISGKHFPVAFSIPFYKLFDSDESSIAKTMFPCDIEVELSEKMVTSETKNIWINSRRKLEELKIYIKRYQQVLQAPISERCLCTLASVTKSVLDQIHSLWPEILHAKDIANDMMTEVNEQDLKFINLISLFCDNYEEIEGLIRNQNDPQELLELIKAVSTSMFLLQLHMK